MNFTEYRSQALKGLWAKGFNDSVICKSPRFSIGIVDNICANNWKADNPLDVCISMLYAYIRDEVL